MLSLFARIYARIADLRNYLYDRGVLDTHDLGVRTISVGNLTTGGTGKTPLVAYIAGIMAARGEKVCILTRGYGRPDERRRVLVSDFENILADVDSAGDEPLELARKLLGQAIVIADADRVSAGEWARRRFGVTTFILDDGFQHRKVKRDVDIVCIDATRPVGEVCATTLASGRMLPAGRLREPLHNLKRAGVVMITRSDHSTSEAIAILKSEVLELASSSDIFLATTRIGSIHLINAPPVDGESDVKVLDQRKSFAFCALGNPDSFFIGLRGAGINLLAADHFPDHHRYLQSDVDRVEELARKCGAERLLTTAKDAVKLTTLRFQMPCEVVEIDVSVDDPDGFAGRL
ncbi:MAG: tetraacyldisaccharide 4'-kinase [Pyrinomonadaceae bacterium]